MTTERKDDFYDTGWPLILFRLWRKLLKLKFFSWKLQNWLFLHMQLKTTSLLKGLPREKLDLNPFHVLVAWDLSLGQIQFSSFQFSRSVVSDSATPWTAAHQVSLSITNSWSLLKLMSIASVMPSNHLILCGQIRTSKKRGGGSQRHFKSQVENYEISVCLSGFMYASVCVFWGLFVFYNIDEVVNEF